MKILTTVCTLILLVAILTPAVKADNPVDWSFDLECLDPSTTDSDGPTPTFIDPWYSQYEYDWALTSAELRLAIDNQWYDIFDSIDPGDKSGSGIINRAASCHRRIGGTE